ncbi:MAG: VWA domain-containing protein [Prevotellaceae bacterium]|jgi:Ca-activated chloride channel family protein|nr:VWA domain-containing protein [Prevotellaceae bacterium]
MFRLAQPEYLILLLVIPFAALLYGLHLRGRRKALSRFGNLQTLRQLMPNASVARGWVKLTLWLLAFLFLVLGICRPQLGARVKEVKRKGAEIIIALDVSNSMMAQDFTPNRLENAKRAIARLVDQLGNDRIGLIVFAGDAYIQLPITSDYVSAKLFLNAINTGIVPRQGTAIGKAIVTAIRSFSLQSEKSRALIIISDGENHEDDPVEAAQLAVKEGIKIYTIGIGSPQGSPIPLKEGGLMKDRQGNMVVTRLDEEVLEKTAAAGNGMYARATTSNLGLGDIVNDVRKLEKQELSSIIYEDFNEQYHYFFYIAAVLLALELLIIERKKGWNIFTRQQ